jgi:hypothetical protein
VLYDVFFLKDGQGWEVGGAGQESAIMLAYSGGKWKNIDNPGLFAKHTLTSVYALSPSQIWAAGFREGEFGKIGVAGQPYGSFFIQYDGKAWIESKLPLLMKNVIITKMKFYAADNGWAVGYTPPFQTADENGKSLQWDGKKWVEVRTPDVAKAWTLVDLDLDEGGSGFGVGEFFDRDHGVILKYAKEQWSELKSKEMPSVSEKWSLQGIAFDKSGSWWAVGFDAAADKGCILKYTGK